MITAREATETSNIALEAKIINAKMKANDFIDIIDQYINIAAVNGEFSTTVYPFKVTNFNSDIEKRVYQNKLYEILETNGYTFKFNSNNDSIEITWPLV